MRIAVCLSGQPRTWRHTYETLFTYFSNHAVDIFFHTWSEIDQSELRDLKYAYSPRDIRIENRPIFLDEKRDLAKYFPISPPFTTFDMFHSVSASLALALKANDDGKPYDLICRTRFDIIHDGVWNTSPPQGVVLIPAINDEFAVGFNDQFALGDVETMRAYAGVSAWLPKGMRDLQGPSFRPEIALQHYLEVVCALKTIRQPLALVMLRDEHVGRPFKDLKDDPMFHARKREEWEAFASAHALKAESGELDFQHFGRAPLRLDRWLQSRPESQRLAVLSGEWPARLVAIDHLIQTEIGPHALDAERYYRVRMICAALAHRMAPDEPFSAESFVVHALSANFLDMRRAQQWIQQDMGRTHQVAAALGPVPMLAAALKFAPPFEQPPAMGWRVE